MQGAISRRTLGPSGLSFSSIALSVNPAGRAGASERTLVASLARARVAGVTTFDLSASQDPSRAGAWIAGLGAGTPLELLIGRSSESLGTRRSEGGPGAVDALRSSLRAARERIPPSARLWVLWRRSDRPGGDQTAFFRSLEEEVAAGTISGWGVDRTTAATEDASAGDPGTHRLTVAPLSLLDTAFARQMKGSPPRPFPSVVGTDPLAGGRLDGSRFSASLSDRVPGSGPTPLRTLTEEFDPVLRLGFLTRDRTRTLAQAAVQFVLAWPWVATVSVPLPPPERLEEILQVEALPPLSPQEVARVVSERFHDG